MKLVAPFTRSTLAVAMMGLSVTAMADAEFERRVEQRLAKLEQQKGSQNNNLLGDKVKFSGLVEIEAAMGEGFDDKSYSDLTVATVELGLTAQINEKVGAELVLLYEEGDTELDVDVATLSFDGLFGPVDLLVGKQYLPFGRFETALVNDTLVLELAETNKTAALFGLEQDGLTIGGYLFDGSEDRERHVENYGLTVSFAQDNFSAGLDYISSLAESDGLIGYKEEKFYDYVEDDGAISISGSLNLDAVTIIGEYLFAVDDVTWTDGFLNYSKDLAAIQIEVDFAAKLGEKDYTIGFAIQETDEAGGLLPEQRISLGASTEIYENVGLGLEFWRDTDYSVAKGGTDEKSNNIVVQLAAEF